MTLQRLHKLMAACGVGSRRHCETLIAEGRVEVDGQVVTRPGTQVDPDIHEVRCDTVVLRPPAPRVYLLNKPRGVICSEVSRDGLPKATDYAPPEAADERLFTIGRLDVESEGALLLTNDGELCHLVTHPRFQVEKTYRVEVDGVPTEPTLQRMRKGVWLAEGRTDTLKVRVLGRRRDRATLEVRLNEGKKREIRRVCARLGHNVRRLVRTAIGPVKLGRLPVGATRPLGPKEVEALKQSADVVIRLGASPRGSRHNTRKRARARSAGEGGSSASQSSRGRGRSRTSSPSSGGRRAVRRSGARSNGRRGRC